MTLKKILAVGLAAFAAVGSAFAAAEPLMIPFEMPYDGKATVRGNDVTVAMTIPWSEIGVVPKSGLKLCGDFGFILSDAAGKANAARVYWSNRQTGLVNDIPHEAKLQPAAWSEVVFE